MDENRNPGAVRAAAGARPRKSIATYTRTSAPTQYVLRLQSRGDDIRRLRWLLKALLRRHSLKCVSIEIERGQP
jgi:hypothetical protein